MTLKDQSLHSSKGRIESDLSKPILGLISEIGWIREIKGRAGLAVNVAP
jgi:hypothetical protein